MVPAVQEGETWKPNKRTQIYVVCVEYGILNCEAAQGESDWRLKQLDEQGRKRQDASLRVGDLVSGNIYRKGMWAGWEGGCDCSFQLHRSALQA